MPSRPRPWPVTTPTANPFHVPGDPFGHPLPFTIVADGFTPGSLVYVEQCDGTRFDGVGLGPDRRTATSRRRPLRAIADSNGVATFSSTDPNHSFVPFKGEGPSSLFNCLSPTDPPLFPITGIPDFRNCQVRVSSSQQTSTPDQAFFTITLPDQRAFDQGDLVVLRVG